MAFFFVLTKLSAPSGPPVGLVGSARSASQIMIQWQPPDEEHRNGMITGYMVRYRLHGYGDNSPWSYRNITNEVKITIKNPFFLFYSQLVFCLCFVPTESTELFDRGFNHLERLRNSNGCI